MAPVAEVFFFFLPKPMPEGKLVKEIPLFPAVGVWTGHFQVFDLLAKELNIRVHADLQKMQDNFIWIKV